MSQAYDSVATGDRLAIVGAGISGLSAAYYLRQRGFDRVTVFEASGRLGGKCVTVDYGGMRFDLSAVIATSGYDTVLELARELDLPMTSAPTCRAVKLDGTDLPMGRPKLSELRSYPALLRLARALLKYRHLGKPGFRQLSDDLDLPITDFLAKHQLSALRDYLMTMFTCFGYGYEEEIPVAYLFKALRLGLPSGWTNTRDWLSATRKLTPRRALLQINDAVSFREGYRSLAEALARELTVELDSRVEGIERSERGVALAVNGARREFDWLIFTVGPEEILAALDASASESELLRCAVYLDHHVFLCEFAEMRRNKAVFIGDNSHRSRRGRPVIISHAHPESNLCLVYAYGKDLEPGNLPRGIVEDGAVLGYTFKRVIDHRRWASFPHLPPGTMSRFFREMEARQGARRTFFAGELMTFASVNDVAAYSKDLVRRIAEGPPVHVGRTARVLYEPRRPNDRHLFPTASSRRLSAPVPGAPRRGPRAGREPG